MELTATCHLDSWEFLAYFSRYAKNFHNPFSVCQYILKESENQLNK